MNESKTERRVATVLVALAASFRLLAVFRQRVNSDEPQHLHVVWAWTQGLLPYRDVFDNHMPLFHLLTAPALLAVGERSTAVLWMRLFMLPLWGLALWLVFRIGRTLFSPRVGLWAAAVAGLWPAFFRCSLEFRPDALWAVLWLGTIAVLIEGPMTPRRGFVAGVILGAAVGVSMKTVMLIAALAVALGATLVLAPRQRRPRRAFETVLAAVAGLTLVPAAITGFFAERDALGPYLYGVIWHNALPGLRPQPWSFWDASAVLVGAPCAWFLARTLARHPVLGARRAFVLLAAATYLGVLLVGWPLLTEQDQLPIVPLAALFGVATLVHAPRTGRLVPLVVAAELVLLVADPGVWRADARTTTRLEAAVLRLTDETDFVLDEKGEAIFRSRPTYWVLEGITKERFRRGLIRDDIADRLVATRTSAVAGYGWALPQRSRRFVHDHYLRVCGRPGGRSLLVAGRRLDAHADTTFDVPFSLSYALVGEHRGRPRGLLDGTAYDGPRILGPGPHTYQPASGDGCTTVLWAQAAARGFRPPFGRC